ncbi:unnamed protein product [Blepharisma stoltei]|uniref:IPO4/5-like TPR repeats domain-containing protein n=1 Tax=Blepharisma stoltei TaxID=1481888 RepID=A0AAU9JA27_9CILI|nr:unnamed protein product [Blepharisma stoltei]
MSDFENIIGSILSKNKQSRKIGETSLQNMLKLNAEQVCYNLIAAMSSENEDISGLAAILFRKKVIEEDHVKLIPESSYPHLKNSLFALVSPQKSLLFLKRLADVLVNFAILHNWANELMTYMAEWSVFDSASIKQFSMYLFELATEYTGTMEVLKENAASVIGIMWNVLQDNNLDVKLSAVKSIVTFMMGLGDEVTVMGYAQGMDHILNIIIKAVEDGNWNPEMFKQVLHSFAELTELYPRIWKDIIEKLTLTMSGIGKNNQYTQDVRAAAVETLVTLIKKAPGILRKNVFFIQETLALSFCLITEVDYPYDIEGWNQEGSDTLVIQNDPISSGKDLLGNLAATLQDAIFPHVMKLIPAQLQAAHWANQHSGILAIGLISDGCHDLITTIFPHVIATVLPFANSDSPRLKWATMTTIGLLCSEFEPEMENIYHAQIIPAICSCLSQSNLSKVQSQAASCLINYSRGLLVENGNPDIALTPYLPTIIEAFLRILSNPNNPFSLLQEVLNSIAMIATATGAGFAPFYNQLIFGLRNYVNMPVTTATVKDIRAASIRCIGCIVESLSEAGDAFKQEAESILNDFMRIRNSIDDTDPAYQAISEVLSHFALCLKDRFAPYLNIIIPHVYLQAEQNVDFKLTDAESADALNIDNGMNALQFELKGLGKKQLAISTTALENKIKACKILYDLVESLETSFEPYAEQTFRVLAPLISYPYNSDIRKFALKTIQHIPACCSNKQHIETLLIQLTPIIIQALTNSCGKSPKDAYKQIKALVEYINAVPSAAVIGLGAAHELSSILANSVREVFNRKIERGREKEKLADMELYEEEITEIEDDENADDSVLQKVMEIVGKMLKSFKTQFQPIFLEYFKNLYGELLYKPNATENEILYAICVFCDYVEFTGDLIAIDGNSPVLEQLIKNCYQVNVDIRQTSAYGLGLAAQFGDRAIFRRYLQETLKALNYIISLPDCKSEQLFVSTECAVGALGKIAIFHQPELIPAWLNWLPLKSDPEEAQVSHSLFLSNINQMSSYSSKVNEILGELKKVSPEFLNEESQSFLKQIIQN